MFANMRRALALGLIYGVAVSSVHSAQPVKPAATRYIAKDTGWSLKLPKEENVIYQGVANFDNSGLGMGQMLYPAPNIAGFFAALITHGIILESARNAQKTKIQEAADRVLSPYQSILADYKYRELMQHALEKTGGGGNKRLVEPSEKPGTDLQLESLPVFSMTQDQTALVMDNAIVIYAPGAPAAPIYKNIIRVVSRAGITSPDLVKFWTDNGGSELKTESVRLLAESLDLALGEVTAQSEQDRPQRTVRYFEGQVEKMERGAVLKENCDRVVLRNLRGWLMSVSPKPGPSQASCADDATRHAPKALPEQPVKEQAREDRTSTSTSTSSKE